MNEAVAVALRGGGQAEDIALASGIGNRIGRGAVEAEHCVPSESTVAALAEPAVAGTCSRRAHRGEQVAIGEFDDLHLAGAVAADSAALPGGAVVVAVNERRVVAGAVPIDRKNKASGVRAVFDLDAVAGAADVFALAIGITGAGKGERFGFQRAEGGILRLDIDTRRPVLAIVIAVAHFKFDGATPAVVAVGTTVIVEHPDPGVGAVHEQRGITGGGATLHGGVADDRIGVGVGGVGAIVGGHDERAPGAAVVGTAAHHVVDGGRHVAG